MSRVGKRAGIKEHHVKNAWKQFGALLSDIQKQLLTYIEITSYNSLEKKPLSIRSFSTDNILRS